MRGAPACAARAASDHLPLPASLLVRQHSSGSGASGASEPGAALRGVADQAPGDSAATKGSDPAGSSAGGTEGGTDRGKDQGGGTSAVETPEGAAAARGAPVHRPPGGGPNGASLAFSPRGRTRAHRAWKALGDWLCPQCSAHCYASREACFRCGTPRGSAPALPAGAAAEHAAAASDGEDGPSFDESRAGLEDDPAYQRAVAMGALEEKCRVLEDQSWDAVDAGDEDAAEALEERAWEAREALEELEDEERREEDRRQNVRYKWVERGRRVEKFITSNHWRALVELRHAVYGPAVRRPSTVAGHAGDLGSAQDLRGRCVCRGASAAGQCSRCMAAVAG